MPECDLVLLHAPSVYDFRQEAILYGPVADFVPVPFAFEVYPLGYTGTVEYLERSGYRVCTLNLAAAMLDNPQFDAEAAIAARRKTAAPVTSKLTCPQCGKPISADDAFCAKCGAALRTQATP